MVYSMDLFSRESLFIENPWMCAMKYQWISWKRSLKPIQFLFPKIRGDKNLITWNWSAVVYVGAPEMETVDSRKLGFSGGLMTTVVFFLRGGC